MAATWATFSMAASVAAFSATISAMLPAQRPPTPAQGVHVGRQAAEHVPSLQVDCTKEVELCREHLITGFPSIRVFRKGHDEISTPFGREHEAYRGEPAASGARLGRPGRRASTAGCLRQDALGALRGVGNQSGSAAGDDVPLQLLLRPQLLGERDLF